MTETRKISLRGLDYDSEFELISHKVIFAIAQEIGLVGGALPDGMEEIELEAELGFGVVNIDEPFTASNGEEMSHYSGRALFLLDDDDNVLLLD